MKTYLIGAAAAIAVLIAVFYAGKKAKENEILATPEKRDTVQLPPVFIQAKPETLTVHSTSVFIKREHVKVLNRDSAAVVALVDSLERKIDTLLLPQFAVLVDSLGGWHGLTYIPAEQRFIEDFRARVKVQPIEVTVIKYVPISRPWWELPAAVLAGGAVACAIHK